MKRWKCIECGYTHEGEHPPQVCPMCYVPSEAFIEAVNA